MLGTEAYVGAVLFLVLVAWLLVNGNRQADNEGYVYFIGGRAAGPIKIGITRSSPEDRLKDLQTGNAVPLKVHASFVVTGDPYEVEGRIHNALSAYHVGGEWYEREPSLLLMKEMMASDRSA